MVPCHHTNNHSFIENRCAGVPWLRAHSRTSLVKNGIDGEGNGAKEIEPCWLISKWPFNTSIYSTFHYKVVSDSEFVGGKLWHVSNRYWR